MAWAQQTGVWRGGEPTPLEAPLQVVRVERLHRPGVDTAVLVTLQSEYIDAEDPNSIPRTAVNIVVSEEDADAYPVGKWFTLRLDSGERRR